MRVPCHYIDSTTHSLQKKVVYLLTGLFSHYTLPAGALPDYYNTMYLCISNLWTCIFNNANYYCKITNLSWIRAVGRDSILVRMPDPQSRQPDFKSYCCRFEPLASLITPYCHSSLSCVNEYLAIQAVVDT